MNDVWAQNIANAINRNNSYGDTAIAVYSKINIIKRYGERCSYDLNSKHAENDLKNRYDFLGPIIEKNNFYRDILS